jgi:integrase
MYTTSKSMSGYDTKGIEIDAKLFMITKGLRREIYNGLKNISNENASIIADYISAIITETNPSDNYRKDIIRFLYTFSKRNRNKPFKSIRREEVISFLKAIQKSESMDPLHKWIGTYNQYLIYLVRFFKWLHFPNEEQSKRPRPKVVSKIPSLKRKEKSIYKPSDLWTGDDDLIFLKYCPSKRIKCFQAMSRDTSCRPHELLKLCIKDIVFKIAPAGNRQYAEVLVNGKTGSRHLPLINSLPYIKDYIDHEHPFPSNPNAILLCGIGRSLGRSIHVASLYRIYSRYKLELFPKLLHDPHVGEEDKRKIEELLKKPWNPYIIRHSALTEKSSFLKEHILRQHAGWSPRSQMHLKYLHYFGNESSDNILEAYGIITKDKVQSDALRSKQCPNCNEPNKPDSKFCAKCRMVLTYDAFSETLEKVQEKESEKQKLREKYEQDIKVMREEIRETMKNKIAQLMTRIKPEIVKEGLQLSS